MGRRKEEPAQVHRARIAAAAGEMFETKGVQATTMDDIAAAAGYSKATLYVYFRDKEEMVNLLALKSMELLGEHLEAALGKCRDTRSRYDAACRELVRYQAETPYYFETVLGQIDIAVEHDPALRETFERGETLNEVMGQFFREGIEEGALRADLEQPQAGLFLWAQLSGVILMAARKKAYIEQALGLTADAFLQEGFDMIYRSIERRKDHG